MRSWYALALGYLWAWMGCEMAMRARAGAASTHLLRSMLGSAGVQVRMVNRSVERGRARRQSAIISNESRLGVRTGIGDGERLADQEAGGVGQQLVQRSKLALQAGLQPGHGRGSLTASVSHCARPWPTAREHLVTRHPRVAVSFSAGAPKKKGRIAPVWSSVVSETVRVTVVAPCQSSIAHRWPSKTASPGPKGDRSCLPAAVGRSRRPGACRAGQSVRRQNCHFCLFTPASHRLGHRLQARRILRQQSAVGEAQRRQRAAPREVSSARSQEVLFRTASRGRTLAPTRP